MIQSSIQSIHPYTVSEDMSRLTQQFSEKKKKRC